MAKRSTRQHRSTPRGAERSPGRNLLLLLTLLPLVAGVLLVFAWALDITLWGSEQLQITLAFLLILISFAASNAVQKQWVLAAGWLLLALADFILLTWIDLNVQIFAFILGGLGLLFLGIEFFRRVQKQLKSTKKL